MESTLDSLLGLSLIEHGSVLSLQRCFDLFIFRSFLRLWSSIEFRWPRNIVFPQHIADEYRLVLHMVLHYIKFVVVQFVGCRSLDQYHGLC